MIWIVLIRLGPVRRAEGQGSILPEDRNFKTSFKTTGTTESDRKMAAIDYAHCKGMKGRFESLGKDVPDNTCHYSYGAASGTQFGRVERPVSARHMLGFRNVCIADMPPPPASSTRNLAKNQDLVGVARQVPLDNVLARAGI